MVIDVEWRFNLVVDNAGARHLLVVLYMFYWFILQGGMFPVFDVLVVQGTGWFIYLGRGNNTLVHIQGPQNVWHVYPPNLTGAQHPPPII